MPDPQLTDGEIKFYASINGPRDEPFPGTTGVPRGDVRSMAQEIQGCRKGDPYREENEKLAKENIELTNRLHAATRKIEEPIPMRLTCPSCNELHIDIGEFKTKPHHTHACQACGMVWRPAVENTIGVQFLPGFRNEK